MRRRSVLVNWKDSRERLRRKSAAWRREWHKLPRSSHRKWQPLKQNMPQNCVLSSNRKKRKFR